MGKSFSIECFAAGYEMGHLRQVVDYRQDAIKSVGGGEIGDQVIADVGPRACWYWEWFEQSKWFLRAGFGLLKRIAPIHIPIYKLLE